MIKTPQEKKIMKKAGEIGALALNKAISAVRAGISLRELNSIAEEEIEKNGAFPGFKNVPDYDYASCINVNDGIVHGIPGDYVLKRGDIVSVDLGAYYEGFYSDLARTVEVETNKNAEFLNAGEKALDNAINSCVLGNRIGDISAAIQETIEKSGYSVSRDLVGHGISRKMHEKPQIPCYGIRGTGKLLKEGMALAIEVIYQKGSPELVISDDAWTLATADGSISGLFEHDVLITKNGPEVLTKL